MAKRYLHKEIIILKLPNMKPSPTKGKMFSQNTFLIKRKNCMYRIRDLRF